ncbi:YceK/YidQ family lipoprotein [Buttiauxella agrestis]
MMKSYLPTIILGSGLLTVSGCSSVMTHTGGQEGTYPGTRESYEMLTDSETSWGYKPFVALDMPFTAVADTVLLPWDLFREDKSLKSRVEASESKNLATNSVIPPVQ